MRVPRFEPFPALRYSPEVSLDLAAAPPYDVLSADDIRALRARHERNIVVVDVPGPDDDPQRYATAAATLAAWEAEGTLVRDASPTFTIYRMRFRTEDGTERETVGVIGAPPRMICPRAAASSSIPAPFSKYPEAPAQMAR